MTRQPWQRRGWGCATIEVPCPECGEMSWDVDVDEADPSTGYSGGFTAPSDPCPKCGAVLTDRDIQRVLDDMDRDAAERWADNQIEEWERR